MLRGHAGEPEHVLVLVTLGAPQRRFLRGSRARAAEAEPDPEPVPTTRATLASAERFAADAAARKWLAAADLDAEADAAFAVLNRVLAAHRAASADPYVREVARDQALVVRVGIAEGEEVAYGQWTQARELPRPKGARTPRRVAALRPQERLAALLSGRDAALACEELTMRARLDLDQGRPREAALQVRVAFEAALAELEAWAGRGDIRQRLDDLRESRSEVAAAANAAVQGGLPDEALAAVENVLERLEAALRARTAAGLD